MPSHSTRIAALTYTTTCTITHPPAHTRTHTHTLVSPPHLPARPRSRPADPRGSGIAMEMSAAERPRSERCTAIRDTLLRYSCGDPWCHAALAPAAFGFIGTPHISALLPPSLRIFGRKQTHARGAMPPLPPSSFPPLFPTSAPLFAERLSRVYLIRVLGEWRKINTMKNNQTDDSAA